MHESPQALPVRQTRQQACVGASYAVGIGRAVESRWNGTRVASGSDVGAPQADVPSAAVSSTRTRASAKPRMAREHKSGKQC